MCGIGGILRTDGEPIPEEWLDAIDARIAYRGPDGHGRFRDRVEWTDEKGEKRIVEVAFVHRRMAIIDLASGGQPMVSERGRNDSEGLVAVVFNGCIYNHRELRRELEARGHRFLTDHSDTEVLIHGWREWKEELPDHLEGMYAFAIWDRAKRALALSRDWCGRKPLYCAATADDDVHPNPRALVIFASSVSAIFDLDWDGPSFDREGETARLFEHGYFGYSIPERTWERHAWRHAVAALTCACDGRIARGRHDLDTIRAGCRGLSASERSEPNEGHDDGRTPKRGLRSLRRSDHATRDIETLIEPAVARRLEADVPLGCFLSGGVDSSLIAHFAKKHKPDLMTFSVRMPDARYDESDHAERVAQHLGTEHRTLECSMNPAEDLVHLIDLLGQPFGDSSILPTYWVSKAAREHVKVALSGDGGDELFIGYDRYMAAPFLARHWWWLRFLPASFLHRAHPKSKLNKLARLVDMSRDYRSLGVAAMESIFTQAQIAELLESEPRPSVSGFARRASEPNSDGAPRAAGAQGRKPLPYGRGSDGRGSDALAALRDFDLNNYLPGDLLRKVDTASMAVALEVRCPYLDRDLARAVLAMPIEDLILGGKRKGLLRQIARKYLPGEVVDRPKMGFAIPIGEWFRDDDLPFRGGGMKTLLLDHLQSSEPFGPIELNRIAVQRFIDEHMSGRRDHSHRLFTLLTLSIWAKRFAT